MVSNFSKFEKICPRIHQEILSLENKLEEKDFEFPLAVRKITESLLRNDPLRQLVPNSGNSKSLNESLSILFSSPNNIEIDKLTKSFQNTRNLKNSFHELKNLLNPYMHFQEEENVYTDPIDKDKKINLLSKLYTILNIIYFGKDGFDFKISNYFDQSFLDNVKLKNIFNKYDSDKSYESTTEKFVNFLADDVIDDFYENESFDHDEIKSGKEEGLYWISFFDEPENHFIGLTCHTFDSDYTKDDLEFDIERIVNNKYFELPNGQRFSDFNSTIYIFAPRISQDIKNKLNKNVDIKKQNIDIHLLNQEDVLDKYFYKHHDKPKYSNYKFQLESRDKRFEIETEEYRIIMASVLGSSIAKAWEDTNGEILKKNLRGYIKNKKIDDSITQTMSSEPEKFVLYNNGITAIANKRNGAIIDGNMLRFDDFDIVNGGQTAKLLADFYRTHSSKKADKLSVLLKVIIPTSEKTKSQSIVDKVSVTSNQQKPIKIQDLWATDPQLKRWVHSFKEDIFDHYFSLKRDSSIKRGRKSIDLPFFMQLATSTIKADPYTAKNSKSKILNDNNLVKDILKMLDLGIKDIQCFTFDLLMISGIIDSCLKNMRRISTTDPIDDEISTKVTILQTGRFFIISLIYFFHLIKNLTNSEQGQIMKDLKSSTSQEKIQIFRKLSRNKPISPILNRGPYQKDQEVNFLYEKTQASIKGLIVKIVDDLLEKTQWSQDNSGMSFDWLRTFKQSEKGWKLAMPFIEKLLKYELTTESSEFGNLPNDNLIVYINDAII